MKKRHALTLAATVAMAVAGASAALAPSAHADSGGGCGHAGVSGAAKTVYSCISALGNTLESDGYVYFNSIPSGCQIVLWVWDITTDTLVNWEYEACANGHVPVLATFGGASNHVYQTEIFVSPGGGVWSNPQTIS